MYETLQKFIEDNILPSKIPQDRIEVLRPLTNYIQEKTNIGEPVNLNFICTHNSRRSHLSQIWAQTAAGYYNIKNVFCYSGGTEETAMYAKVAETLSNQGFQISQLSEGENPVYAVKFDASKNPVIAFSKKYNHPFNPEGNFAAIITCDHADDACPVVAGAELRIPVKFEDPKKSDGTPSRDKVYSERSLEIAAEMFYVFSQIR